MPAQLIPGRIIWADDVPDPAGRNPKRRAFIVLSHQLSATGEVEVVGVFVTGTFRKPPPEDHVILPWHRDRRAQTLLTKPSAAVCSYIYHLTFAKEDEIMFGGFVGGRLLETILAKVKELNAQQGSDAGEQGTSIEG